MTRGARVFEPATVNISLITTVDEYLSFAVIRYNRRRPTGPAHNSKSKIGTGSYTTHLAKTCSLGALVSAHRTAHSMNRGAALEPRVSGLPRVFGLLSA